MQTECKTPETADWSYLVGWSATHTEANPTLAQQGHRPSSKTSLDPRHSDACINIARSEVYQHGEHWRAGSTQHRANTRASPKGHLCLKVLRFALHATSKTQ